MSTSDSNTSPKNRFGPLAIMVSLFFLFGFITVMNEIIVPELQNLFNLSFLESSFVQSSFFLAYFLCAFPAGWLITKVGYKKGILIALVILVIGLVLFIITPSYHNFYLVLGSLFVMGVGITIAQVVANPYIVALGTRETASSRLNLAGGFNSLATTVNTIIGGSMLLVASDNMNAEEIIHSMRNPYFIMAGVVILLGILIYISKLPEIKYDDIQESKMEIGRLFKFKNLVLGAFAIFFYVGAEVSIGNVLIKYLQQPKMGGFTKDSAFWYVALYSVGAMVGRVVGFFTLQKIKAERGLIFVSIMAVYFVFVGMFTSGMVSRSCILMLGLCNSIMWPCIFPLAISGLGRYTTQGSGLVITMVVGGAIIPVFQAYLAENVIGYNLSFVVVLLCYVYILYYALVGHKLVAKTINQPTLQ